MKIIYNLLIVVLCGIMVFSVTSCNNDKSDHEKPHECETFCETCGRCKDIKCDAEVCKNKCNGDHVNLPDIDVGDLK